MTEWITVASSAIKAVGYDASNQRMYIDFQDSQPVYIFCGVPESVFRDFVGSVPLVGTISNILRIGTSANFVSSF